MASNVRAVAGKLRDLGWTPRQPSLLEGIERDVEIALKSDQPAFLK